MHSQPLATRQPWESSKASAELLVTPPKPRTQADDWVGESRFAGGRIPAQKEIFADNNFEISYSKNNLLRSYTHKNFGVEDFTDPRLSRSLYSEGG